MIEKVIGTISKYNLINDGDKIIIGVSGGPDSVCLLHLLNMLRLEHDLELFAVHVNHMLRGSESDKDEEYVSALCEKLGIPLIIKRIDINTLASERGLSLEEAGRAARYEIFSHAMKENNADKIAVAHNKNDQAETVLMRIIRGTGIEGLKGMEYKRNEIIRPLLDISRKEIEQYCKDNDLHARIDSSNLKNIYTRNKIRLDLIPLIDNTFDANVSDALVRLSQQAGADIDFINNAVEKIFDKCSLIRNNNEVYLYIESITGLHQSLKSRILRKAIGLVKGNMNEIESKHIELIEPLMTNQKSGAGIDLPEGIRIERSYDKIKISKTKIGNSKEGNKFTYDYFPGSILYVKELDIWVESRIIETIGFKYKNKQNSLMQYFDYDKIRNLRLVFRNRRDGDIISPYNMKGTKKLKDLLIDSKIQREERDRILLLAADREIIWVAGMRVNGNYLPDNNSKRILKIEIYKK